MVERGVERFALAGAAARDLDLAQSGAPRLGRGTADLVEALTDGQIAGAGLDVTEPEPLPSSHPLWQMDNVIITPHVSAGSDQIRERVFAITRENLRRYVAGERMLSVVDIERGY